MSDDIYRRLAEHLDRLPGGFPRTADGEDLRVLALLFTPEEAHLALHLTIAGQDVATIAAKAGLPEGECEQRLEAMARKGLLLPTYRPDAMALYQAVPYIVGILEFQVGNPSRKLGVAMYRYDMAQPPSPVVPTTGQMRTIPIGKSITPKLGALPYEQVEALVARTDRMAVAPCICRLGARAGGGGCSAPLESCLMFGKWADHYVRNGIGRYIEQPELTAILARAEAANLVLQPSNSKEPAFICTCCGCCCGVLQGFKAKADLRGVISSPFIASLAPESCEDCGACLKRCQMGALVEVEDRVALKSDRCIGCGLCVSACPAGALTLDRRPESEQAPVPETLDEAWEALARARARGSG